MSSANHVPETRDGHAAELSADEAWETLRRARPPGTATNSSATHCPAARRPARWR